MTSAERKSIERSREAYDKLTSLEQFELCQFASDLDKLSKTDPKEYAELEATMDACRPGWNVPRRRENEV